jgi:hypothetical protein
MSRAARSAQGIPGPSLGRHPLALAVADTPYGPTGPARQRPGKVLRRSAEFVQRLDALEPEIAVEHTDIPQRVDRDVLEKVGEQVAAGALPEEPAAAD